LPNAGIWPLPAMTTLTIVSVFARARIAGSWKSRTFGIVFRISGSPRPSAPWQRAQLRA
jgi:hypothetical protein